MLLHVEVFREVSSEVGVLSVPIVSLLVVIAADEDDVVAASDDDSVEDAVLQISII